LRSLLSERFAPITSSIGFLEVPLVEVLEVLRDWRTELYRHVTITRLETGFPDALRSLEPLVLGARPREILVAAGGWTAYFDSGGNGTDAGPPVGVLAERIGCQGLVATAVPNIRRVSGVQLRRYGQVMWQLFGPLDGHFLNYVRTIGLTNDGVWHFDLVGTEQAFEETDAYAATNVRHRFTSEMLERYCREIGIDVFNENFYGPECVLVESDLRLPTKLDELTLVEAQQRLGIVPGVVDTVPG
jgi:hypothetical protein